MTSVPLAGAAEGSARQATLRSAKLAVFDSVAVSGVTKLFGHHRALVGVSFALERGGLCALLGPNGAGKSTLVGVLSTLVRPTAGEVHYRAEGADMTPVAVRSRIGVLAHESFLYGELTAHENLAFWGSLYDVPDLSRRATAMLDAVELEPAARNRPARTFSRGMQQRLALARAMLHEPSLLLLDEPFTGLDRRGVEALGRVLGAVRREGRIVLVVTHDLEAIADLCDHVVVLRRGKVVLDERRAEVFSHTELKERYHRATEQGS